jgi:hypothetical protein
VKKVSWPINPALQPSFRSTSSFSVLLSWSEERVAGSMARKKGRRGAVVSSKCFRLLRLKHEIQTDVKVLKAVVDEVDVLRLCRSLGMALSDEGNAASKHEFEFGMFNSCDYDADFARFLREKLVDDRSSRQGEDPESDDVLDLGCLFGKQLEVKAELARLGRWSRDCDGGLSLEDQGVYCIERGDAGDDRRQFVVFAWLDAGLFEPEAVRDTPAYVLRFLVSLSSSITCCLSQEDFRRIKSEVDAASDSSSAQWKSCSVAFRVQKQVEQSDSISCGLLSSVSLPRSKSVKSVRFVGGAFPAIAVENKVPSTTEWVDQTDLIPCDTFAEWLLEKRKTFVVHMPSTQLLPPSLRDNLLAEFDYFPDDELNELRSKADAQQEEAAARIGRAVPERERKVYEEAVRDAQWLFAVRCAENASQTDAAQRHYDGLMQQWEKSAVFKTFDYEAYKMIYLPERIQENMVVLDNAFQRHQAVFDEVLNRTIAGDPIVTDEASGGWLAITLKGVVRGTLGWLLSRDPQYSSNFRLAMEGYQPRLVRLWSEAVKKLVHRIHSATYEERLQRSTFDREDQLSRNVEAALQGAFGRLCEHLKSGDSRLGIKIRRMALTSDGIAVNIAWSEEHEKEPSKVIGMFQLQGRSTPPSRIGRMEFEPGVEIRKLATVKVGQVVAILGKDNTTIVRRIQFPLHQKAEQSDVRTFPRACSLCSIRASDRRVAFLFGVGEGRLGTVAFCRFNEAFSGVELTSNIDMDAYFGLTSPLADILLTERSFCAVDSNGDLQAFDVRTRRTSKKVSCKSEGNSESKWIGGLLSFADELVVGRVSFDGSKRLSLSSISNEDHREMPSAMLELPSESKDLDVGAMDDVLFIVDSVKGTIHSSELSVTVRSDAYRIQRSRNGARGSRSGRLRTESKGEDEAAGHWLRVFFHMFEKFPVRSLVDMYRSR